MNQRQNTKELRRSVTALCNIVPPIGFALYFVYRRPNRKKANEALLSACVGVPIGIIMGKFVMPYVFGLL